MPMWSKRWISRVAEWLVIVLVPVLLVGMAVRILLTDQYLRFEYGRPHFPEDVYGFTLEERLYHALLAVEYLVGNHDAGFLAGQVFAAGASVYNERELQHMRDVQVVVVAVLCLFVFLLFVFLGLVLCLLMNLTTRNILHSGLIRGAMLTLGLIGALVLVAALSWDTFFVQFHQVFFEEGTWRFAYSDTLIRLFPEQFWFDAALAIGLLTAAGALSLLAFAWFWKPRQPAGTE